MIGEILQETYRIERLIGEGRMGKVYEASHLRLPRRFAVKVMTSALANDKQALARFRREAELTSRLGHPNIVEVVDFNHTQEGEPYIVMELLEGIDLAKYILEVRSPSMAQVAGILQQAASALHATHEEGIVHRDLKPSNLFITHRPNHPDVVKVVDFGISKMLGTQSQITASDSLLGTPYYMAPEQAEGRSKQIDRRTDVYALGAILYELVTGKRPFEADSLLAVVYKVVQTEPVPPREIRPELSPDLEGVVLRAMAKDPEARFGSTLELSDAFVQATGADPAGELLPPDLLATQSPGPQSAPQELSTAAFLKQPSGLRFDPPGPSARPRSTLLIIAAAVALLTISGLVIGYSLLQDLPERAERTERPARSAMPADRRAPDASPRLLSRSADARQRPDAARPPQLSRRLSIATRPAGATVTFDGELLGETPLLRVRVPRRGGTLTIEKTGYHTARKRLAPGRFDVQLQPVRLRKTRPARPPAKHRPMQTASLRISSLVDGAPRLATIYVDGVKHGQSPLYLDKITVGRHTVEARRPGFRRSVKQVTVRAGRENSVVFHLRR